MFKKDFAQKLRELLKHSGVRQKEIAEKLGISHASVSQFMHGVALPRMEQFRTMLEMMNVPVSKAGELSFQLMMARAGSQNGPAKTTPSKTTKSGFSRMAIRDLPGDLLLWQNDCLDFFITENVDATEPGIPVITLGDLEFFDFSIPLETYARNRTDKIMKYRSSDLPGTVLVLADGVSLALPHCGTVKLCVVDNLPDGCSSLELFSFNDDTFRIIPDSKNTSGHWESFFPKPQFDGTDVRWKLPVLEVGITPVYERNTAKPE